MKKVFNNSFSRFARKALKMAKQKQIWFSKIDDMIQATCLKQYEERRESSGVFHQTV